MRKNTTHDLLLPHHPDSGGFNSLGDALMNQDDGYFYEDWPVRRDKALLPGDVEGTAEQRRAILGARAKAATGDKSLPTLKVDI